MYTFGEIGDNYFNIGKKDELGDGIEINLRSSEG